MQFLLVISAEFTGRKIHPAISRCFSLSLRSEEEIVIIETLALFASEVLYQPT
jgi:hypothetical protein